jgi:hypothetical protein
MSQGTAVVLVAAKTATVAFGGALTLLALRAYRRTGSDALRALTVGIGLLMVGALIGGAVHQLLGLSLGLSVTIQSVCTAAGFAVMTYSLFTDVQRGGSRTRSGVRTGD